MRVLANQARFVQDRIDYVRIFVEELIEFANKTLLTTVEPDHAGHIVKRCEGVLPGICLAKIVERHRLGIKWLSKAAVSGFAAKEPGPRVEHVGVIAGAAAKLF